MAIRRLAVATAFVPASTTPGTVSIFCPSGTNLLVVTLSARSAVSISNTPSYRGSNLANFGRISNATTVYTYYLFSPLTGESATMSFTEVTVILGNYELCAVAYGGIDVTATPSSGNGTEADATDGPLSSQPHTTVTVPRSGDLVLTVAATNSSFTGAYGYGQTAIDLQTRNVTTEEFPAAGPDTQIETTAALDLWAAQTTVWKAQLPAQPGITHRGGWKAGW